MVVKGLTTFQKRLIICGIISLIVGAFLGGWIGSAIEAGKTAKKVASAEEKVRTEDKKKMDNTLKELYELKDEMNQGGEELPWNLTLVNYKHPMEEGYVPKLVEIEEGSSVDSRIADATQKMLKDAKKAGLNIQICSAYRSVERQKTVFGESMRQRVKEGMSYWDAYEETSINVAQPGTSEHALGLALDLISDDYEELDGRQETTAESKWLAENCHKYGFILRYPPDTTAITGIIYEPWHYRYVGVEVATEIMEKGITLEEYLQDYYEPKGGE